MKSSIIFRTNNKNRYIFDIKNKCLLLTHPILLHFYNSYKNTKGSIDEIKKIYKRFLKLKKYKGFFTNDIKYYYDKFLLLFNNGYFSDLNRAKQLSGVLNPKVIKSTVANTKQITFEVTDRCNLKCEYCGYGKFYGDYDKRENKNLDVETAKNLLNYFQKLWNSNFNKSQGNNIYISFYGGEPLLNFKFIEEIVNFVKKLDVKHNRFTFSMTTNGVLIEKYMDFLVENKFNLLISLDGNSKNNSYRVFKSGKSSYRTVLENILALKNKYPDYFKEKINFNSVLHNKNSVSEIYHYFKENFDKVPRIGELNTSGIRDSKKEEFRKTYSNVYESLKQAEDYSCIEKDMFVNLPNIRSILIFLHKYSGYAFNSYNDLIFYNKNQSRTPTGTCLPFSKKVFVTVNGKILPCERIGQQYALGYANKDYINLDFERIAKKYNRYFDKMRKQCNLCYNSDICQQCIFNLKIEDENPKCNGFMGYEDFSKYLSSNISYLEKNPEVYAKIMNEVVIE